MVTLKAHFDGKSIVLDEPASLAVGQPVSVVVPSEVGQLSPGAWKGKLRIVNESDDVILDHFKDYLPSGDHHHQCGPSITRTREHGRDDESSNRESIVIVR